MNTYPAIIKSFLEEARTSGREKLSLVDLRWQYDARNKQAVLLEEINDALKTITGISLSRDGKELFLCYTAEQSNTVEISPSDFKWADNEYRRRFRKEPIK